MPTDAKAKAPVDAKRAHLDYERDIEAAGEARRTIYRRADRAGEAQALGRLRLHQARHTYASFMIAAGVNAKALSSFMGHSPIKVTFNLYGHLMPIGGAITGDGWCQRSALPMPIAGSIPVGASPP